MQTIELVLVGLVTVTVACGGTIETSAPDADTDALPTTSCEAGVFECAGPMEPCGRRVRTCNADGTWSTWTCSDPSSCP